MKIQVEATTKEPKTTQNGAVYTGVKIKDGDWVNIYGNHVGKRGQTLNISEPKPFGKGLWASIEKVAPGNDTDEPPEWEKEAGPGSPAGSGSSNHPTPAPSTPAPSPSERKTVTGYLATQSVVHAHAKKLEPDPADAQARAMLVNEAMRAWAEGKIV